MRMLAFTFALPLLFVVAFFLPTAADAQQIKQVEVTNLPAVQDVFVTNPSAPAPPARFQLVGFTTPVYDGDLGGPLGATQTCQEEGFEGSRMCTTPEVMGTVDIPEVLVGTAWVRLIFSGNGDISGAGTTAQCNFWTDGTNNNEGLAVTAEGAIFRPNGAFPRCNVTMSIACCAPVP